MTDENIETRLITETQNIEDHVLNATVNLAIEMIRIKYVKSKSEVTEFCEHVYPALKNLQ